MKETTNYKQKHQGFLSKPHKSQRRPEVAERVEYVSLRNTTGGSRNGAPQKMHESSAKLWVLKPS